MPTTPLNIKGGTGSVGVIFPKGAYITFGRDFSISKDGIAKVLSYNNGCCNFFGRMLLARLLAILETITFVMMLPFMLLIYIFIFVIMTPPLIIFIIPGLICARKLTGGNVSSSSCATKFTAFNAFVFTYWLCSFISLLVIITEIILIPFQIIVPELTAMLLCVQAWGPTIDLDD